MIDLMKMGLAAQQAIVDANKAVEPDDESGGRDEVFPKPDRRSWREIAQDDAGMSDKDFA